jgi:hypothetical protein
LAHMFDWYKRLRPKRRPSPPKELLENLFVE